MCASRCAEQDHLETRPAPDQLRELGGIREVGHMPTARLLGERELKAFAAQRALIDDREVATVRVDKPVGCAARKARLGLAQIKDPVLVAPPSWQLPVLRLLLARRQRGKVL